MGKYLFITIVAQSVWLYLFVLTHSFSEDLIKSVPWQNYISASENFSRVIQKGMRTSYFPSVKWITVTELNWARISLTLLIFFFFFGRKEELQACLISDFFLVFWELSFSLLTYVHIETDEESSQKQFLGPLFQSVFLWNHFRIIEILQKNMCSTQLIFKQAIDDQSKITVL